MIGYQRVSPSAPVTCCYRIKSDTPPSRFTTLDCIPGSKNIGFHYVWSVAYPLPVDGRGHESKALLADHGYFSRFRPSARVTARQCTHLRMMWIWEVSWHTDR